MRRPLPAEHVEDEPSSADPVEEAIRRADLAALWSAIAALPKPQRDALLLREFGGLSYAELATALDVTGSAVESLLFRARHGVKARLEAAYAALSGASWIEAVARLFGGVGGGLAPVAAKVAVVGVGAAVATGGYVAAPHVLRAPPTSVSRPAAPARRVGSAPPVAVLVAHAAAAAGPVAAVNVSRRVRAGSADGRSGDGRSGEGETAAAAAVSERSADHESERSGKRVSTAERSHGDDGSSSGDGGGGGDGGSGDGGSGGSGDGGPATPAAGSGGSATDGGVATTTTNPAVTVAVPVADTAAPVVEPVPTGAG